MAFILLPNLSAAQQFCNEDRYSHMPVFDSADIVTHRNITFGIADDRNGNAYRLTMDITYPDTTADTLGKIPVIVMAHGGAWLVGDKNSVTNQFNVPIAMRGYMVISINYRLGWNTNGIPHNCAGNTNSFLAAIYRSVQDINAALRFIASEGFDTTYRSVDTANIFAAGASAGAVMALSAAFMDQDEIDFTRPILSANLGRLDTSGNKLTFTPRIKAVASMWGGIMDTSFIDPDETIPVISFHGLFDSIVPYNANPVMYCTSPNTFPILYSGAAVTTRLKNTNVCFDNNRDDAGGHAGLIQLFSNDYINDRLSCFFKSTMCNDCADIETADTVGPEPDCDIVIASQSLPIELVAFEANHIQQEESVEILWETSFERGVKHYEVLRSFNGTDFKQIGIIKPSRKQTERRKYRLLDRNPRKGKLYYRLRTVYRNGSTELSKIRIIQVQKEDYLVYPNPFIDQVKIKLQGLRSDHFPLVYNQLGEQINYQYRIEGKKLVIATAEWPSGVYLLKITGNRENRVVRLVKNHD